MQIKTVKLFNQKKLDSWEKNNIKSNFLNTLYVVEGNHIKKINKKIKKSSNF